MGLSKITVINTVNNRKNQIWRVLKKNKIQLINFNKLIDKNAPKKFKIIVTNNNTSLEYLIDLSIENSLNQYKNHHLGQVIDTSIDKIEIIPFFGEDLSIKNNELSIDKSFMSYELNFKIIN
jgi:hypothetical protein